MTTVINCAFQTWENGNITETSGIYFGEEAKAFVNDHYNSGTFATLHTFEDAEEGQSAYYAVNDRNYETTHPEEFLGGGKVEETVVEMSPRWTKGDGRRDGLKWLEEGNVLILSLQDLREGTEDLGSDQRSRILKDKVSKIIKAALGEDCRYLENIHYTYRDGVIHRLVTNPSGFSAEEYTTLTGYLIPRSTSSGVILEKDGKCVLHEYLGDVSAAIRGRDFSTKSTLVTALMAETDAYIRIV